MQSNFAGALKRVLIHEGGYVNHPKDPGGATNRGVTQRVYDGFRRRKGLSVQSVRSISEVEVAEIYRIQYANVVKFDQLPLGVDEVVFDGAVNSGPSQSVKWLQRALGNVRVDGVIGVATLNAVNSYQDHDRLIALMLDRRMAFLKALKTWSTFGKGWTSRLNQVKKNGQALARGSVGINPVFALGGNAKANLEDAKSAPSKAIGDATAGGGGIAVVIEQLTGGLGGLTWIPQMDKVVSVLTAVGAVMIAAGLAYRFYQKRREDALVDALDLTPVMPSDDVVPS